MFISHAIVIGKRLASNFYIQDTIEVARHLLGKILVHHPRGGPRLSGRIVETEAYLGLEDPAAHSFGNRRTNRTEPMFGIPGLSYIYFIYGNHFCFNVVTAAEGVPEAVLVRALEPIDGLEVMRARRTGRSDPELANGPGKLCAALGLGRAHNALDLSTHAELWIEDDASVLSASREIAEGPRIGIGREMDHVFWPLRFGIRNHPALSKPAFPLAGG